MNKDCFIRKIVISIDTEVFHATYDNTFEKIRYIVESRGASKYMPPGLIMKIRDELKERVTS
tara:strand:- start:164 stop:349 length:186 start_codon:yes stop_codon:yes gene_type:complete